MEQSSRFFAVISTKAGKYGEDLPQKLTGVFESQGKSIEFIESGDNRGELCTKINEAISNGFQNFLVMGGDGTISTVAGCLYEHPHRLGIIPVGTVNTLARILELPLEPLKAAELIASSTRTRSIDGMEIDSRISLLNVSLGPISASFNAVDTRRKSRFGILSYSVGVARNLTYLRPVAYHIKIDGRLRSIRAVEVVISNTGIIGTPRFHLWDNSVIDDGQLEVLAIRQWSPGTALDAILDVSIPGKKHAIALIGRGKEIQISSLKSVPVLADGDPINQTPVKVTVLPKAINLIVPQDKASQELEARS